jgi:signal transduction histidine kinase
MNFQLQRRFLFIGTIFTLIVTSAIFTYFIHSQNESARIQLIEDKLKGDAKSILTHLYSSGNSAWFNDALESYKQLGITCLNVKNASGQLVWGNQSSCSNNIEAKNYIDQKVLDISYDLPQVTVLSTIKTNGVSFVIFFSVLLSFLTIAYWILKKISKNHTDAMVKIENLNSLNKSNENLLQVTRTLAHNLRSPLAAIKMFHDLTESKLDSDEKKILNATHDNISHMVEKLIEQKILKSETTQVSISKALDVIIGMKKVEYKNHHDIKIEKDIQESLFSIVNEDELMSIISNLLNNSIEARKNDAPVRIMVTAFKENNSVVVKVRDNGIGIDRAGIQDLFGYGHSTKTTGKGCGLYHAKEMIEVWNGSIEIHSTVGEFTEVTLKLPLLRKPKEIILIDNENLNLYTWQGMAKKNHITFRGFKNSKDFFNNAPTQKDEVAIYVDYDLDDENGLDVIMKLKNIGFTNVNLATGESLQVHPEIRQVGKEFPVNFI